jgi:hypothetical protein
VPLLPWSAAVLAGMAIGRWLPAPRGAAAPSPAVALLAVAGRHSLVIYLLHQPVLLGLLFGVVWLGKILGGLPRSGASRCRWADGAVRWPTPRGGHRWANRLRPGGMGQGIPSQRVPRAGRFLHRNTEILAFPAWRAHIRPGLRFLAAPPPLPPPAAARPTTARRAREGEAKAEDAGRKAPEQRARPAPAQAPPPQTGTMTVHLTDSAAAAPGEAAARTSNESNEPAAVPATAAADSTSPAGPEVETRACGELVPCLRWRNWGPVEFCSKKM